MLPHRPVRDEQGAEAARVAEFHRIEVYDEPVGDRGLAQDQELRLELGGDRRVEFFHPEFQHGVLALFRDLEFHFSVTARTLKHHETGCEIFIHRLRRPALLQIDANIEKKIGEGTAVKSDPGLCARCLANIRTVQYEVKVQVERHVVLQPLPAWSLVQVHDWSKDLLSYTVTGKDVVTRLTSKIGVQEAQQIVMTLSIPDAKLLERVKRVVKVQNVHSLAAMTEGMAIEGTYEAGSGTITLMEFLEMLYGDVTPMKKAVRSFTLLHECGEAVWTMLQESDKEQWKKVSWPRTARKKVEKHFLTFYAHHKDEKEDFCDHFAAYILHGPEFRMATASARPLKRKYRLLRSIIATLTGVSSEFPCFIPWTIREIQGALEQEIEHMELKDAIELEEKKAADSYLDNQERIFEIRKSFEQLVAQDERKSNAQDAEDPDDRKAAEQEEEDEDEEYENPIQEEEGLIEVHEIRAKVTDVLESIMDPEELEFRSLRRKVVDCLLDGDWEGVEDALDFLDKEDKEETMDLLYEIDAGPQRPC